MISEQTLAKLRQYDTPTICNVIELFDVRSRTAGFMDGRIVAAFPELPPMVGFAATATFRASAAPRQGDVYSSLDKQVERFAELSGPAVVVFQDLDSPVVAATFGEVMCTSYQDFGAVGIITSGAGRDLDQVRQLRLPAFTNGTICAHGYSSTLQIHVPVHVGGIVVYPDDLLHGDCNGVTTIPHDIVDDLLGVADEYIAAEKIVLDAVRQPNPSVKLLREARVELKARMEKIRARVSRARK